MDEMLEWQHWLNGHEFEQAPGSLFGKLFQEAFMEGIGSETGKGSNE